MVIPLQVAQTLDNKFTNMRSHLRKPLISGCLMVTHHMNTMFVAPRVVRLMDSPRGESAESCRLEVALPHKVALVSQICQTDPVIDVSQQKAKERVLNTNLKAIT